MSGAPLVASASAAAAAAAAGILTATNHACRCNWCKTSFDVKKGKPLNMCVTMDASKILPSGERQSVRIACAASRLHAALSAEAGRWHGGGRCCAPALAAPLSPSAHEPSCCPPLHSVLFECDKKPEEDEGTVAELTKMVKCTKIEDEDDCDDEDE